MKMKLFPIIAILILVISCKKYGFNAQNGYEDYVDSLPHAVADTLLNAPDYSFITQATIFPGLVPLSEGRIDTTVEIDSRFVIVSSTQLKISAAPQSLNNVGLYEAPGEPVKVVVPQGVYNLTAQIGAWTDNLSSISNPRRYPQITASFKLYPGVNYIRNPFGGSIFISPTVSEDKIVKVQVSGAVKSPDFFLGKTTNSEWSNAMARTNVPFFILRGKHVAMVLPTSLYKLRPFNNPQELMDYWDLIYERTFIKYTGLSQNPSDPIDQAPELPMYYVFDAHISVGYWHSGFPIMVTSDLNNFGVLTDLNHIKMVGSWGALHENGHNYQMPSIFDVSNFGETTCNLYSIFLAHENNVSYATALEGRDNVTNALNFVKSTTDTSIYQLNNAFAKIVMFSQLFNRMDNGWDFWPYLYKKARRQTRNSFSDIERWNFLYIAASEFNKKDMAPFFSAWKIPISSAAKTQMAALYPTLDQDIWNYNPVTNSGGNSYNVNSNTSWSVIGFSSEESVAAQNQAINTIDGNANTYWHSQWTGGNKPYPHFVSYDLKTPQKLTGLYFIQRPGVATTNGKVKTLNIYTSSNGTTWTLLVGNATLLNNTDRQTVPFPTVTNTRYIKVELTAAYNGLAFGAMGEIGAY